MTILVSATPDIGALIGSMSLEQKLAQLVGVWAGYRNPEPDSETVPDELPAPESNESHNVAPLQDQLRDTDLDEFSRNGLGQLTRFYGTRPVEPARTRDLLAKVQRQVAERSGHGIAAVVHEECLTGVATYGATCFPCPLAWGSSWDPTLIAAMASAIGETMAQLGIQQGLAPVLDVVRDARWGRVEECIAEDPYLVGVLGTEYVRGLQSHGAIATLKHFIAYSSSQSGRNLAPVHIGQRELRDVFLPPFEMAIHVGGARSVMQSYTANDGVPCVSDEYLLTGLLRHEWGFTGTVVADYSAITMLMQFHKTAQDITEAAMLALHAGVDVELPTGKAYLEPLAHAVRAGDVPESLVDRALERVLRQKAELGLIGPNLRTPSGEIDLDPLRHRALSRAVAEESVILLHNPVAILPLQPPRSIAVIGPNADSSYALLGSYSFPNHVGRSYPELSLGVEVPTVLDALRAEYPETEIRYAQGCDVRDQNTDDIAAAVDAVSSSDVCIAVVGDLAGLFGRGTVGEGCDVDTLELPGVQRHLIQAAFDTGTPVILVLVTGRPYAIDWALGQAAAVVQAFLPGEEGASAVAGVLSGRINPSGRLPVSLPRSAASQPAGYLRPLLAGPTSVSVLDPTPILPFGHGLSYSAFEYGQPTNPPTQVAIDAALQFSLPVTNASAVAGTEVIQVYVSDLTASVTRPERFLVAWTKVEIDPGQTVQVEFDIPTDLFSFTNARLQRVVEPGAMRVLIGRSSQAIEVDLPFTLTGEQRWLGPDRRMQSTAHVDRNPPLWRQRR